MADPAIDVSVTNEQVAADLPNADDIDVAIDELRDHVDMAALQSATKTYEMFTSGASGLEATRSLSTIVPLSNELFAAWRQDDEKNRVEKFVREMHNISGSKDRQEIVDEMSLAMYAAICASDEQVAKAAREGDPAAEDANLRAKMGAVRARTYGEKEGQIANQPAAIKLIDGNVATIKDASRLEVWKKAKGAIGDVTALRRMGADLAALRVNAGRWRLAVFMPAVADLIDEYKEEYGTDKIGALMTKALSTSRRSHKTNVDKIVAKGEEVDPKTLIDAIRADVKKEVILPASTIGGGKVKSEIEKLKDLNAKLWSIAKQVDKAWSTTLTDELKRFAKLAKLDLVTSDVPVALAPDAKGANGSSADARSNVAATNEGNAAAQTEEEKAAAAQRQAERDQKAAAASAAQTRTVAPSSKKIAELRKKNA